MSNQYDNFSFDPGTIGSDWKFGTQPAHGMRPISVRISKWNVNYTGPRDANDYTKTTFGFAFKGTIENPKKVVGIGFGTDRDNYNYNPFVWGYAVSCRRVLNDPMFKMTEKRGTVALPNKDVMDQKEVSAASMTAYKNYPTEGYSSFGKKYDKARAWAGNTWINGVA